MILKLSIIGLLILLIVILTVSYYTQLEGFISTKSAADVLATSGNLIFTCGPNTDIQGGKGNGKIYKASSNGRGGSVISLSQEPNASTLVSNCACLKFGENVAADVMMCTASAAASTSASSSGTAGSNPTIDNLDACAGITDKTPASKVPLSCLQQIWVNNRCTLKGGYLPDIQSEFAKIANVKNFDDSLINFGIIKMGLDRLIAKGPVESGPQCLGPAPVSSTGSDLSKGSKIVPPSGAGPASVVHVAPVHATVGSATTPQRNDIKPQVTMSDTSYDAMALKQKSDLLSNIQKMFRNELLANRSTDVSMKDTSSSYSNSSSTQQGNEFNKSSQKCDGSSDEDNYRCPKNPDGSCPPVPDMSQYIKKDAIPCWGCSVDY
jgi:hypothetical protein